MGKLHGGPQKIPAPDTRQDVEAWPLLKSEQDNQDQDQFSRRWIHFEADSDRFPLGLRGTVSTIRQRFPSIKHVAVWHALVSVPRLTPW